MTLFAAKKNFVQAKRIIVKNVFLAPSVSIVSQQQIIDPVLKPNRIVGIAFPGE
jgi:hypothetical protein